MAEGEAKRWGCGWLVAGSGERVGGGGLCVVQAEGTSLAKQTSSNLVQRQSPEDINFTCIQTAPAS